MKTLDPDGNPAQDAPPDDKPTWGDSEELVERLPTQTNAADEYRRKFDGGGYE